jgi:hypothetical protein
MYRLGSRLADAHQLWQLLLRRDLCQPQRFPRVPRARFPSKPSSTCTHASRTCRNLARRSNPETQLPRRRNSVPSRLLARVVPSRIARISRTTSARMISTTSGRPSKTGDLASAQQAFAQLQSTFQKVQSEDPTADTVSLSAAASASSSSSAPTATGGTTSGSGLNVTA